MKIMSVNAGSSSLKFSLFDMDKSLCIASGYFERVGLEGSFYTIKYNGEKIKEEVELPNHTVAVEVMLDRLITLGIIKDLEEIDGIGHRIVHGYTYDHSVIITDKVIEDIKSYADFAPLHNHAHILGIEACKKALPNVPMVAVFDTAYHQTMKEENYIYPVPYNWYTDYGVRKYGAHGTSHKYIAGRLSEILNTKNYKAIICHLGSGCSLSAVKDGICVDTSMGFTPLAGVMMGTRSGDIDPSIIPYIMEKEGLNAKEVVDMLNKKSGLLGVSMKYSDYRDIRNAIDEGDEQAILANKIFVNTVVKYIANYYVELEGIDALVFTAGLGENSSPARHDIISKLKVLGISIDEEKNKTIGEEIELTSKDSKVRVFAIPTNEELMIAKETLNLI